MAQNNIEDVLKRYFCGESLPGEEQIVAEFINGGDNNMKVFRELERQWKNSHKISNSRVDAFLLLNNTIKRRKVRRISVRAAAAVAVVLCISTFVFKGMKFTGTDKVLAETAFMAETGPLERTMLTLPDGTNVWINSSSKLSYHEDAGSRNVQMTGEAYFDVVKDMSRPFIVNVNNHTITVKGTKFNVTSFEKENCISAALLEGSIEFSGDMETVQMVPGELLEYDCKSGVLHKIKTDLSSISSWREGKIDCSSMHFSQFLIRLEFIYGVELDYDGDKYSDVCLSFIINTSEPLQNILDAVASLIPVKCRNTGNGYVITEK